MRVICVASIAGAGVRLHDDPGQRVGDARFPGTSGADDAALGVEFLRFLAEVRSVFIDPPAGGQRRPTKLTA
jgi:hypothetical protein